MRAHHTFFILVSLVPYTWLSCWVVCADSAVFAFGESCAAVGD